MKMRRLGNTDIYLSELAFGGASIGNLYTPCSNFCAQEAVETSWDLGIRYFDTAPEYGHGLSERRLGDALRQKNRDEYILSTKVGDFLYAHHRVAPKPNKFIDKLPFHLRYDYSYDGVMRGFEDSLQRLGLDKIDILLVHDLDPVIHQPNIFQQYFKTYIESGYKALEKLRSEGVIRALGLGVKKTDVCVEAAKHGDYDCFMLQGNYTLLEQHLSDEFLTMCAERHISILIAGPYASGILATGPVPGAYFHHREANAEIMRKVTEIQAICASFQIPLQAAAIQFPLTHPQVASVVVGAASAELMRSNVNFFEMKIPSALWDALAEKMVA